MSKKSAEEKVREKLNKVNDKLTEIKFAGKLKKLIVIASITVGVIALVIFGMCMDKVREIAVEGDLAAYNETRVIEASGIDIGESIFGKTAFSIKRTIRKNIPMTESVRIRKNIFTGRVRIIIEFEPFDYFIKHGDSYYAVDENLIVMDVRKSKSEYFSLGARYIEIPEVCAPIIGKELVFLDTVPENEDDKDVTPVEEYEYIYRFLKAATESGSYGEINVITLNEKFNISGVYSEKYRVYFGGLSEMNIKFKMLDSVLSEGSLEYAQKGIIDLTDPSKVSARAVEDTKEEIGEGFEGETEKSPVDFSEYFS